MKKSLACLLIFCTLLAGCSRGGSDGILGTWTLCEVSLSGDTYTLEEYNELFNAELEVHFTFNEDGTYSGANHLEEFYGEYEREDGVYTMDVVGEVLNFVYEDGKLTCDDPPFFMVFARQ